MEVKPRADLPASSYLTELAGAVNAQEGWRFDLAVVNPKHPPLVDEEVEHLGQAEIIARIRAIRQLVKAHQDEAAILLAWSTAEATLRLVAEQHGIALEDQQPASIIKKLYSLGILSHEDYEALQRGLRVRTIVVPGFRLPEPEPHLTETLIGKIEELLHEHMADLAM